MNAVTARFAGVVAIAMLAAGCTVGDPTTDGLVTRADKPSDEMTALVGGRLAVDGDCFLLSGLPVVWPAGTKLSADGSSIELPNGSTVSPGDLVQGGGGQVPAATIRDTALQFEGDLDTALRCAPSATEVVVFTVRGDGMTVS